MENEMFTIPANELYEFRKEKIRQEEKIKELEEKLKEALDIIQQVEILVKRRDAV
jgi:hypothetical protein